MLSQRQDDSRFLGEAQPSDNLETFEHEMEAPRIHSQMHSFQPKMKINESRSQKSLS